MIRLNNKGQSLVLFVLIIPVILLILVLIVDMGNAMVKKNELDNVCYLAMDYAISNELDSDLYEKIINLVKRNLDDVSSINIDFSGDIFNITVKRKINGIISEKLILTEISSSYNGYVVDDRKVIERL